MTWCDWLKTANTLGLKTTSGSFCTVLLTKELSEEIQRLCASPHPCIVVASSVRSWALEPTEKILALISPASNWYFQASLSLSFVDTTGPLSSDVSVRVRTQSGNLPNCSLYLMFAVSQSQSQRTKTRGFILPFPRPLCIGEIKTSSL